MEGKEWVWDNGVLVEKDIEAWKLEIYKTRKREFRRKESKKSSDRFLKDFNLINIHQRLKNKRLFL